MVRQIACVLFSVIWIGLAAGSGTVWAGEMSDEEILAKADARIEAHRKGDGTVLVVDAAGKPLSGVRVQVDQTRYQFLFGCNIFCWGPKEDRYRKGGEQRHQAAYRNQFESLFNYATLPFYWMYYEPHPDEPRHAYMDTLVEWCRERGIAVKGHPLAWNWFDPSWLPDDSDEIHRRQLARIDDCAARFAGRVNRWDVVNEATHYDRPKFVSQISPKYTAMWKKYGRMELTRECFLRARKANPDATLLINDYRLDTEYEKVIEQLVDPQGKRLYDVIGMQSHMGSKAWPNERIWKSCEQFARFGVPLHFTEASVVSGTGTGRDDNQNPTNFSKPEAETVQAREAVRFYTVAFSHPAVEAITWWDFCDWSDSGSAMGLLRKDMTAKPIYSELKALIKDRWWTETELETSADGRAKFRGFLGDYRVRVTRPGKDAVVRKSSLDRSGPNLWTVTVE